MKIVATVEARMESSRLPGKTLAPILGRPMLEVLIERVRRARRVDQIVVATTDHAADQPIEELARRLGVGCFGGSSEDVLDRVLKASQAHQADLIVELTGDCPLLDPEVIDQVIALFLSGEYDYVSNVLARTYPRGLDTQVFPVRVLEEVAALTLEPADRENVSLYIYEHPERYRLGNLEAPPELRHPELRLTVDTAQDLELVREIYQRLYPAKPDFTIADVIRLLQQTPELREINQGVKQRAAR